MRNISFSATTSQMRNKSKTVTRRLDAKGFYMRVLKPGTLVRAVEKAMGLKKGERMVPLGVIEIVDVRRERLDVIATYDECCHFCGGRAFTVMPKTVVGDRDPRVECLHCYRGTRNEEVNAEGFLNMPGDAFVDLFCHINRCDPDTEVTRIEFVHRPDLGFDGRPV